MTNIYSFNVPISATAYIRAEDRKSAIEKVRTLSWQELEVDDGGGPYGLISTRKLEDPELPDASLGPVMMIGEVDLASIDLVEGVEQPIDAGDPAGPIQAVTRIVAELIPDATVSYPDWTDGNRRPLDCVLIEGSIGTLLISQARGVTPYFGIRVLAEQGSGWVTLEAGQQREAPGAKKVWGTLPYVFRLAERCDLSEVAVVIGGLAAQHRLKDLIASCSPSRSEQTPSADKPQRRDDADPYP